MHLIVIVFRSEREGLVSCKKSAFSAQNSHHNFMRICQLVRHCSIQRTIPDKMSFSLVPTIEVNKRKVLGRLIQCKMTVKKSDFPIASFFSLSLSLFSSPSSSPISCHLITDQPFAVIPRISSNSIETKSRLKSQL